MAATASRGSSIGQNPAQNASSTPVIPSLFTSDPPVRDELATDSSQLQDETVEECAPFLKGHGHDGCNVHGIPPLLRHRHVKFLQKQLGQLPPMYKSADSSRPWMLYWCLNGLSILGEDVAKYRSRLIETVRPMQNEGGGFGGGFGQTSHLATTYPIVLSLALVGGTDAYEVIDRRSMWKWLCSLKQPDGAFQMAVGGEKDVSAGHTDLFGGLADWVRRCQTYEGGVSAAPGFEAHGAYAFCALACLAILDSPHRAIPEFLDVPRLLSWLSSRQHAPEGGFSGRTNKLVDGCYSHWVGGCWPLIEASLRVLGGQHARPADDPLEQLGDSVFNRNGLIRYILCCCQDLSQRGGLRDKPGKYSDAYHSCYVLCGLSSAQHKWVLVSARADAALMDGDRWTVSPFMSTEEQIFQEVDRVGTSHPVYVIPQHKVDDCQQYFAAKAVF
ncbi:hypothetical protein E4U42_000117 [Claviceps africana]|uniref:Protein farnesyltransferase subunit beta n=1 Tax=Claviceps africana TaxID=83212 RepID=A0A8K0J219_9HYPO|nr:hypothetical protein E4U42_000117 [Claviceps africana]